MNLLMPLSQRLTAWRMQMLAFAVITTVQSVSVAQEYVEQPAAQPRAESVDGQTRQEALKAIIASAQILIDESQATSPRSAAPSQQQQPTQALPYAASQAAGPISPAPSQDLFAPTVTVVPSEQPVAARPQALGQTPSSLRPPVGAQPQPRSPLGTHTPLRSQPAQLPQPVRYSPVPRQVAADQPSVVQRRSVAQHPAGRLPRPVTLPEVYAARETNERPQRVAHPQSSRRSHSAASPQEHGDSRRRTQRQYTEDQYAEGQYAQGQYTEGQYTQQTYQDRQSYSGPRSDYDSRRDYEGPRVAYDEPRSYEYQNDYGNEYEDPRSRSFQQNREDTRNYQGSRNVARAPRQAYEASHAYEMRRTFSDSAAVRTPMSRGELAEVDVTAYQLQNPAYEQLDAPFPQPDSRHHESGAGHRTGAGNRTGAGHRTGTGNRDLAGPYQQPSSAPISQDEFRYQTLSATADDLGTRSVSHDQLATAIQPGWWQAMVPRSLRSSAEDVPITLEETLYEALANSAQVRVFSQLPPIRKTAVVEADAAFDWHKFLDIQWDDLSDPVGNTLTTGPGIGRFRDHHVYGTMGIRRRTRSGAQVEFSQRAGHQDNNSQFFIPERQGTSQITLGFTQPLMRGRGKVYNTSLVCLAQVDHAVARDEYMRQLQSHLLEVSRAYWAMYLERGVLYQKLQTFERAQKIVHRLQLRRAVDASASQIKAAEAALTDRQSDLVRAYTAVKNAEARLRSLVNSDRFGDYETLELIPVDAPSFDVMPVDLEVSVAEAIQERPEVKQAIKQIKAASIRMGMAKHELLPVLNLVTNTYVAGLEAKGDVGGAWVNQFNQGEPGYSVGLQFEVPIGNRAARARSERRALELKQLRDQYQVTLQTVQLEVKVAVREVETAKNELLSKQEVVHAREAQLDQLIKRWERLPNENVTTSLVLENILRAQEDLSKAEYEYLQSQITYNLSRVNLRKATGTLFQHESINLDK